MFAFFQSGSTLRYVAFFFYIYRLAAVAFGSHET